MDDERTSSSLPAASTPAGLRGRDLVGIGGLLAGAVVAGLVLGLLLDHAFGTAPVCTLLGIFAGILVGAVGFWVRVRTALRG